MGAEKVAACNESVAAMALQAIQANQQLAASFMQAFWFPWLATKSRKSASRRARNAMLGIAGKGMAPVRRRAVANARRLSRTKLR